MWLPSSESGSGSGGHLSLILWLLMGLWSILRAIMRYMDLPQDTVTMHQCSHWTSSRDFLNKEPSWVPGEGEEENGEMKKKGDGGEREGGGQGKMHRGRQRVRIDMRERERSEDSESALELKISYLLGVCFWQNLISPCLSAEELPLCLAHWFHISAKPVQSRVMAYYKTPSGLAGQNIVQRKKCAHGETLDEWKNIFLWGKKKLFSSYFYCIVAIDLHWSRWLKRLYREPTTVELVSSVS